MTWKHVTRHDTDDHLALLFGPPCQKGFHERRSSDSLKRSILPVDQMATTGVMVKRREIVETKLERCLD